MTWGGGVNTVELEVDAVLDTSAGRRTLRFALPSLGYHFALELDSADRIVSERIVTPNLLTRSYSYS